MATVVLRVLPLGGNGWQQLRGPVTRVSGGTGACGPHGLAGVIGQHGTWVAPALRNFRRRGTPFSGTQEQILPNGSRFHIEEK